MRENPEEQIKILRTSLLGPLLTPNISVEPHLHILKRPETRASRRETISQHISPKIEPR